MQTTPLVFRHYMLFCIVGAVAIFATPGLISAVPLAGGDDGTAQTISMLRSLVDDAWKDPYVNRTAIEVIRRSGAAQYDTWAQIHALYDYAHSFYFVNDPITKETVRPTRDLLELGAGDCDDINGNILPALLGSIGLETRLVTIAADPNTPNNFSHVYCEVYVDGQWIPLDAARPGAVFAVAPPYFFRRAWWDLIDGSHGDYPAEESSAMAGYRLRGMRGLGSLSTDLSIAFNSASSMLRSIGGQTVQPVVGSAIGPGGAMIAAPGAAGSGGIVSSGEAEILFLLLAGGLIWWGLK